MEPVLVPRLVSQDLVVAAAAAAAFAVSQVGAPPIAVGDAVAEAIRHLWRWSPLVTPEQLAQGQLQD